MGVYIKGMEMPKSCWDCEVGGAKQMDNATCPFYSMEYWEQENYQDKIAYGCPLVPVPPHGRCIDADKLLTDKSMDIIGKGMIFGGQYVFSEREIVNAPTIIEADLPKEE